MIDATRLIDELADGGFGLISGVPCSYMTGLINTAIASERIRYVAATNEGDAIAVASGAELAGTPSVVIFQNSGLGNAINPLTSLVTPFRIPMLIICSWRGRPGGAPDEPQHEQMGRLTPTLFETLGIPWQIVDASRESLAEVLAHARRTMLEQRKPFALILEKGAIGSGASAENAAGDGERRVPCAVSGQPAPRPLDPDEVLRTIRQAAGADTALVATTGFTGRALLAQGDGANQFYLVGAMGCASSLGLGLALARPQGRVVVLDGDGALLMRMGALASVAAESPTNLLHVVLDNGVHDSTGAQATQSPGIDLCQVAAACGYASSAEVASADDLAEQVARFPVGPAFLRVRTTPRADRSLPRPKMSADEIADRFRSWLAQPQNKASGAATG